MSDSASHKRIAELAFSLFEARGRQHGLDLEDWFEAERMLNKLDRGRPEIRRLTLEVIAENPSYTFIYQAAKVQAEELRERIQLKELEGLLYYGMTTLVFTAFTLEAHLNHLLHSLKFPYDAKEFWLSPSDKLEFVCQQLGFSPDTAQKPYSSFGAIFTARDDVAHGQTEELTKNRKITEVDGKLPKFRFPSSNWENRCEPDEALRLFNDMRTIVSDLHSRAGLGDYPFLFGRFATFGDS